MKFRNSYLLIGLIAFTLILSCKKENDDTTDPTPNPPAAFTPLVTAVGTPVGSPNSATIGVAGGSIFSDDGRLEVIVPPNALNVDTEISIQPITNECPGGAGLAYELSPDGIQFSEAVMLTFHYTDEDVLGSDPKATDVATQYDDNIWYSEFVAQLDEVNSTLSISTTHFSPYAFFQELWVNPTYGTIQVNENINLSVYHISFVSTAGPTPLGVPEPIGNWPNTTWTVNGDLGSMTQDGWMTPESGSSTSTYTAPAHINNMTANPAAITAIMAMEDGSNLHMSSNITVQELGEQYTLHFESDFANTYTTFQCLLGGGSPYWDGFDVHITLSENGVTTNSISNLAPAALFSSVVCDCQNIVFDGQGSLIEFSNFVATHDGSGQLFFDYTYSWNGPDETIDCGDGSNTFDGMDWTEVDGGNFFLPADSVVYDWWPGINGTVKIVHVE